MRRNLSPGAAASVLGNRAGLIEWANEDFGDLVGLSAGATLQKPIGSLLDRFGVDPAAVGYVSRRFLAGETCDLELPYTAPAGGERWLHVRVEPSTDASGDVARFAAFARDITEARRGDIPNIRECDLSRLVGEAAVGVARELGEFTTFDPELASELPPSYADRDQLTALVQHLIRRAARAIGPEWGTVSLTTGLLGLDPEPIWPGRAARGLPVGGYLFVEVHDTGLSDPAEARSRLEDPFLPGRHPARGLRFPNALKIARELGGRIEVTQDGAPGTGVLLVLPA